MAFEIPSLESLNTEFLANIEKSLNVKTPENEKAFNRVLAAAEAAMAKLVFVYCADMTREAFVRTASRDGLSVIGEGYGVYPQEAARWRGRLALTMQPHAKLPLSTVFVSPQGGKYTSAADCFADGSGTARPVVEAVLSGAHSSLEAGAQVQLQVPIAGAAGFAMVTDVLALGREEEETESYRQRLLDVQQTERGSANAGDYRAWAQAVGGVRRAYPFTGRPIGMAGNALPLETVTYIECAEDIEPDGIAPQPLLDRVKDALTSDPDTGESRLVIGHTSDVIYVRPITRTGIYVKVFGLTLSEGDIGAVQQEIKTAFDAKLRSLEPYVMGCDAEYSRSDTITESVFMQDIQNILDAYGGRIDNVTFGTTEYENTSRITLERNQKLKLFSIGFVN